MINPNADPFFRHVVRMEHQALLKKIEADWLYHQLRSNQPGLWQRINQQVKTAGQWIKSHTRPTKAEPYLDRSNVR
jgi:hypothetical protein